MSFNSKLTLAELKPVASKLRSEVIRWSHSAQTAHVGSCLSCIDILTVCYWQALNIDPSDYQNAARDRFILSKGHAALALYVTLHQRGFFNDELMESYAQHGSALSEHPAPACAPGIESASGSLGHGLGTGIGMALAARIAKQNYRTVVLLSDGECNEGSVWEAAMLAPAHKLNNLVAVIDFNKWQATGRSVEVTHLQVLSDKWKAFGWHAVDVDGHDVASLAEVLAASAMPFDKPLAVIAHTIKGKGVSFMEDDNNWHYRIPSDDEMARAFSELSRP